MAPPHNSQKKMRSGLDMYLASTGQAAQPRAPAGAQTGKRRERRKPRNNGARWQRRNRNRESNNRYTYANSSVRVNPPIPRAAGDAATFSIALRNPFDPRAFGARVVDSYTIPTATYHVRSTIQINSNASGYAMFMILPSPCLSMMFGSSSGTAMGTQAGLSAFSQNSKVFYATSPTTLGGVLTEYRTVACGFRFVAKDTAFASKGKVFIAQVPTTENAPSWNTFETVTGTDTAIGEYVAGLDLSQGPNLQIAGLPSVRTFSMQDLLRGEVCVNLPPTSSNFYEFKGTTDRSNTPWNTGQVLADEGVFNNTTGLVNATAGGRKDIASLRGGRAAVILASGLPSSSNEFDIELIYHLEGTPNVNSTANSLVPSSMRVAVGNTTLVEKVLSVASKVENLVGFLKDPLVLQTGTKAAAFLGLGI